MSNKPPSDIANSIKDCVFQAADEYCYLGKTRSENGKFLDDLVAKPEIGGVLANYMNRAEVRTYIKDAILNRYSKDKTKAARPKDLTEVIKSKLGFQSQMIDKNSAAKVYLYKAIDESSDSNYVVAAEGTVLKWETALRKALLYIPGKPFSEKKGNKIHILLNIFAQHKPVSPADKMFLEKALVQCCACVHIFGEG